MRVFHHFCNARVMMIINNYPRVKGVIVIVHGRGQKHKHSQFSVQERHKVARLITVLPLRDTNFRRGIKTIAVMPEFGIRSGTASVLPRRRPCQEDEPINARVQGRWRKHQRLFIHSPFSPLFSGPFSLPSPRKQSIFLPLRFLDAMDPEKMFSDNALVSVVNIGPQHYAMCETPFMLQVNTQSLETEERVRCYFFSLGICKREK